MRTFGVVARIAVVSAVIGFCIGGASAQDTPAPAPAPATPVAPAPALKKAPDFMLKDSKDKPVSLADYKGKIVVLEWTNPTCPFVNRCYASGIIPTTAKNYANVGVVWLAIDSTYGLDRRDDARWSEKQHLPYPILADHIGAVARLYSAKSTPDMFILDAAGNIVYQGAIDNDPKGERKEGYVNYVSQALDEILAKKPVSVPETKSYGCSVKYPPEPK